MVFFLHSNLFVKSFKFYAITIYKAKNQYVIYRLRSIHIGKNCTLNFQPYATPKA